MIARDGHYQQRNAGKCPTSCHDSRATILWCLRWVVAFQCIGIAGRYALSANECESDVYEWLFFDLGWPEPTAQLIDDLGAYGCLFAAILLVLNGFIAGLLASQEPSHGRQPSRWEWYSRWIDTLALFFVAFWVLGMAATHSVRGEVFAELTLGELAVRVLVPIALALLICEFDYSSQQLLAVATWLLTFAVAITFAVHGYKSLLWHGPFVDLVLLSDMRLFHLGIEQVTAQDFLTVIGWCDIAVAVALLTTRWPSATLYLATWYMATWGGITAASRMTAYGLVAWPETLIRTANWGAPLGLMLLLRHGARVESSRNTAGL